MIYRFLVNVYMKVGPPCPNMVELYMARKCRWGVLRVIGGDLHLQEADAVVTPANNRLSGREGIRTSYRYGRCGTEPTSRMAHNRPRRALHSNRPCQPIRLRSPYRGQRRAQHDLPVSVRPGIWPTGAEYTKPVCRLRNVGAPALLLPSRSGGDLRL